MDHVFTAPTGFRRTGTVSAQYKRLNQTTGGGLPAVRAHISDDGRTLTLTYDPHVHTGEEDRDVLVHTGEEDRDVLVHICGIKAAAGAGPGRHNGTAQIGTAPTAKLHGEVPDPGEED